MTPEEIRTLVTRAENAEKEAATLRAMLEEVAGDIPCDSASDMHGVTCCADRREPCTCCACESYQRVKELLAKK